jgi:hypothetical protein
MQEIEDLASGWGVSAKDGLGLCLRKMAFYVDARGTPAVSPREISHQRRAEGLNFALVGGGQEDVASVCVLPSGSEQVLFKPKQACLSDSTLNRVDAFFAKRTSDHGIDVHAEGQMMTRIVMNPGCGWDCMVHPQPTIEDLISSIHLARQRNTRVLYLSGQRGMELGFEWNANDAAREIKTYDDVVVSALIGTQAVGQKGPIECVVLNACCTEKMGRMLRERGVPNVVCWKTEVQDETAREMCGHFFSALGTDKERKRDYKGAFEAAMNAMRPVSHTHGAKGLSDTVAASDSVDVRSRQRGIRGIVMPWEEVDVVLFLSNDGDSEPIYLWRKRPVASAPLPASAEVKGEPVLPWEPFWKELKLLQLRPEIVKRIGSHLTAETEGMLRNLVETILKEQEAGVSKCLRLSGNRLSGKGVPSEEEVVKEVLEDLHAWPIRVPKDTFKVSALMGASSLSSEERAGEDSVVFPLVVVRVLQVSYCLFKSMCRICPQLGTDATALQDGKRLAASQVESDFRLYEVPLRGVT